MCGQYNKERNAYGRVLASSGNRRRGEAEDFLVSKAFVLHRGNSSVAFSRTAMKILPEIIVLPYRIFVLYNTSNKLKV